MVNEGGILKLNQSWKVKSFTKGLELFKLVADVAEAEGILLLVNTHVNTDNAFYQITWEAVFKLLKNNFTCMNSGHHPDLHLVGWNNVTIEIWTHAVGM